MHDRRTILRGLAAAIPTAAVASVAVAAPHDPVLALLAEEPALYDWVNNSAGYEDDADDDEVDRRVAIHAKLEERIYSTAPTTAAGLLGMIDLYERRELNDFSDPQERILRQIFDHARALLSANGGRA